MSIKKSLTISVVTGIVILLTIQTQTGGILLLLMLPVFRLIERRFQRTVARACVKTAAFLLIYVISVFTITPIVASWFGRLPLAVTGRARMPLEPVSIITVLCNRHYVTPELRRVMNMAALTMQKKYPGCTIAYMDASFPFIDGFPLIPHLSHNDGRKVDIAFYYKDKVSGGAVYGKTPSWIGYGGFEGPLPGEEDKPRFCTENGYAQYGMAGWFSPFLDKSLVFDEKKTAELIKLLAADKAVGKIFIEPHLKTRLGLSAEPKIRFHGCHAVRHDDHIHVQL